MSPIALPPSRATRHERRPISLRHVKMGASSDAGAVEWLGHYFVPQPIEGLNAPGAWTSGDFELRLGEEGTFTLELPNKAGADNVLHRRRFAILTDPGYEAGDEWIEIYEGDRPALSDPLFVGTPTEKEVTPSKITLSGFDVFELGKTIRETSGGFWRHAPRDVWEHYAGTWRSLLADDFRGPAIDPVWDTTDPQISLLPTGGLRMHFDMTAASPNDQAKLIVASPTPEEYRARCIHLRHVEDGPIPAWRAECHARKLNAFGTIALSLRNLAGSQYIFFSVAASGSMLGDAQVSVTVSGGVSNFAVKKPPIAPGEVTLAIEGRDGWVLFYLDGQLIHISSESISPFDLDEQVAPAVTARGENVADIGDIDLLSLDFRVLDPLMLGRTADLGEYRLPGLPVPAGVLAEYFDDRDLSTADPGDRSSLILNPTRSPINRRIEQTIAPIATGATKTFPVGVPEIWMSVRWTGAIYLDLEATDIRLRARDVDDKCRVWVGKTRVGEEVINDWPDAGHGPLTTTGPYLRASLGSLNGWYPIVVEWAQLTSSGTFVLEFERAVAAGVWAKAGTGACPLSPLGIYNAKVRGDSFYEQLRGLMETFGHQARVIHRPLGHPAFPGELAPRIRQGRDTDKVIDYVVGGEPVVKANSRDVVHSLTADAAGIAAEGAQLTLEQIDHPRVAAHPIFHGDAISLAEISYPELLRQRLGVLQTLRRTAWEEVSVQPEGTTELRDSFLLTGSLARFRWEPGEGARLAFDAIDVIDATPRQITGVRRAIAPNLLGDPELAFRPRPRGPRVELRGLSRQVGSQSRNYQGQLVERNGSHGGWTSPTVAGGVGAIDSYSRISLPDDVSDVIALELVVQTKSDATRWDVALNGVVVGPGVSVDGAIVDLTPYIARDGARPRLYARAVPAGGPPASAGSIEYALRAIVRI